jgi:SAM-dependent methyltransferase
MGMRDRYDNGARLYARYWAPVLHRSAEAVVDLMARAPEQPQRVLDLGTGTGVLARAVARRFPAARVTGTDFSRGMLGMARSLTDDEAGLDGRIEWLEADAARLPIADASVDAVVSSFVLQLVPERPPVYREIRRVLRPGGRLAFVTWCVEESPFAPSEAFEDALEELDVPVDEAPEEKVAGDFKSARAARDSLRRAGFRDVRSEAATLEYAFTPESYVEYKLRYDDRMLVDGLRPSVRRRLEGHLRAKMAALPAEAFLLRAPIVYATARH